MDGPGFEILYQDEHCLVVNKPPGLLTQAPPGIDSLEVRVRAWLEQYQRKPATAIFPPASGTPPCPDRQQEKIASTISQPPDHNHQSKIPSPAIPAQEAETETQKVGPETPTWPIVNPQTDTKKLYLGVPHRLDRPVSGAILFALSRRAAQRLSAQFERRSIKKLYWACLEGRVEPAQGTWKDFLRKVPDQPRAEIVPMEHPEALYAVLHYRVLAYVEWGSWVEIQLDTGRYHQIRIQAASRGHPVLGDVQYGARQTFGPPVQDLREQPIALHARTLVFRHPKTKQTLIIRAPLPDCWKQLHLPDPIPYPATDPPCNPWEGVF
ncbi:MAG: RluA family pseudouridine synthase [Thermoguttaceae bacterium]|nr:RluA family pseudouridine synthase [Thermoguttaceae bacterium]MDW8037887.1 RluA family pseudouridine synthase [Thermoguttaceae bacterium]